MSHHPLPGYLALMKRRLFKKSTFGLIPIVSPHFSPYFKEGRYWVPDIFDQLYQKFFFWDEDTIAYMCAEFEQSGILMMLEVEDPSQSSGKIIYHTLNYDVLREMSGVKPMPASPFIDDILGESVLDMGSTFDPAANENIKMQSFFSAKIHKKTFDVYAMEAQDLPHFLACELLLEIQARPEKAEDRLPVDGQTSVGSQPPADSQLLVENKLPVEDRFSNKAVQKEAGAEPTLDGLPTREVICHFPKINDVELKEFVWGDTVLYGILMVTFQMNVLEQLFLFCETHKASKLLIFADNVDELGIYKDFLAYKDKSKNINPAGSKREEEKGKQPEIIIPVDQGTLDVWAGFMKAVTIRFRQVLRDGQKTNPAIQHYLNFRPLSGFDPQ
jgi:hypothetical protein